MNVNINMRRSGKTHDDILGTAHLEVEPGILPLSHLYRLLAECFDIIERRHIDAPDLYRAAGNKEELDTLYRYYWNYRRLDASSSLDFMSLASLAKGAVRRFTEQKEDGLFSNALLDDLQKLFRECGSEFTAAEKNKVHVLLEKHTSRQQLSLIVTIIVHLSLLIKRAPDCTCRSLEICWNPTLLGPYRFLKYNGIIGSLISAFM